MANTLERNQEDQDLDLKKLFIILWSEKIKIIVITVFFALASLFYALSLPNLYQSTALLASSQSDNSGLTGSLSQLGGLASLAGVNLGSAESSEVQIAQEIMKSWSFIESFIKENDLSVKVYAANGWNKSTNKLEIDPDIYDSKNKKWLYENKDNIVGPPSSWELFEAFSSMLTVSEDRESGLVSVSIEYYSPHISKQWVDLYVKAINEHMQERQVTKVTNNINYLQAQIEKSTIAEMRNIFYTIIAEQTKNKMVAEASPDYAFIAVSPSMVPELKSQPTRSIICIIGTLLGGMIATLIILLRYQFKNIP